MTPHRPVSDIRADRPTVMLVRHAERFAVTDLRTHERILLTERGKQDACELGGRLAGLIGSMKVYHSPVRRCGQTAEHICRGAAVASGTCTMMGPLDWLGGKQIGADQEHVNAIVQRDGIRAFLRSWFEGSLPRRVISPLQDIARLHFEGIRAQLAEMTDDRPGLVVDVTHDWNLMVLLEHFLGLTHEETGWPSYLDYILVERSCGGLTMRYHGTSRAVQPGD